MKRYQIPAGTQLQFTSSIKNISGYYKDITTSSFWVSADESVATIDQSGLATSVAFSGAGGGGQTEWAGTWILDEGGVNTVKDQTFASASEYQFIYNGGDADYQNWVEVLETEWGEGIARILFIKRSNANNPNFAVGYQDQSVMSPMEDVVVTYQTPVVGLTSTVIYFNTIGLYSGPVEATPVGPFSVYIQDTSNNVYMMTSSFYVNRHWRLAV
jgi:hypothetical protein